MKLADVLRSSVSSTFATLTLRSGLENRKNKAILAPALPPCNPGKALGTFLRSAPNTTDARRIGLAISYIPTHVRHIETKYPAPAMLVRGVDTHGHFELEEAPAADFDAASRVAHAHYYTHYRGFTP